MPSETKRGSRIKLGFRNIPNTAIRMDNPEDKVIMSAEKKRVVMGASKKKVIMDNR